MAFLDENGLLRVWTKVKALIPTKISDLVNDSDFVEDSNYNHTDNNYTNADKTKVGYVDTNGSVSTALGNKVDKVTGKGLSTNDYTTAEKTKLAGLTNYVLPKATTSILGGVKVDGTSVTVDSDGTIHSVGGGGSQRKIMPGDDVNLSTPYINVGNSTTEGSTVIILPYSVDESVTSITVSATGVRGNGENHSSVTTSCELLDVIEGDRRRLRITARSSGLTRYSIYYFTGFSVDFN